MKIFELPTRYSLCDLISVIFSLLNSKTRCFYVVIYMWVKPLCIKGLRNIFPLTEFGEFPVLGNEGLLKYIPLFIVKFL
jgi:hypothetical protein